MKLTPKRGIPALEEDQRDDIAERSQGWTLEEM